MCGAGDGWGGLKAINAFNFTLYRLHAYFFRIDGAKTPSYRYFTVLLLKSTATSNGGEYRRKWLRVTPLKTLSAATHVRAISHCPVRVANQPPPPNQIAQRNPDAAISPFRAVRKFLLTQEVFAPGPLMP